MNAKRIQAMQERLQQAFSPSYLVIEDDSWRHQGHAGSRDGAGHFTVSIVASSLLELSRIAAHRAIYASLDDFMPHDIHALCIHILPSIPT